MEANGDAASASFHIGHRCAEIDVEGLAIDHKSRHGIDACRLGLGNAFGACREVHDFDSVTGGIQRAGKRLLRADADRTASVEFRGQYTYLGNPGVQHIYSCLSGVAELR